jgi:hypothetical protein
MKKSFCRYQIPLSETNASREASDTFDSGGGRIPVGFKGVNFCHYQDPPERDECIREASDTFDSGGGRIPFGFKGVDCHFIACLQNPNSSSSPTSRSNFNLEGLTSLVSKLCLAQLFLQEFYDHNPLAIRQVCHYLFYELHKEIDKIFFLAAMP